MPLQFYWRNELIPLLKSSPLCHSNMHQPQYWHTTSQPPVRYEHIGNHFISKAMSRGDVTMSPTDWTNGECSFPCVATKQASIITRLLVCCDIIFFSLKNLKYSCYSSSWSNFAIPNSVCLCKYIYRQTQGGANVLDSWRFASVWTSWARHFLGSNCGL